MFRESSLLEHVSIAEDTLESFRMKHLLIPFSGRTHQKPTPPQGEAEAPISPSLRLQLNSHLSHRSKEGACKYNQRCFRVDKSGKVLAAEPGSQEALWRLQRRSLLVKCGICPAAVVEPATEPAVNGAKWCYEGGHRSSQDSDEVADTAESLTVTRRSQLQFERR